MADSATSTRSNGNGKASSGGSDDKRLDDLYKQIEVLKEDLGKLTSTFADVSKNEAQRAVDHARLKGMEARAKGEEHLAELRSTAEGYGRDAQKFVREQPGTALGIVAGLGFVIGFLMSSRR